MGLTLSLNTNPLVNRFAEPTDLITAVARDLKIRDLQLTHEFINPSWSGATVRRLTREMQKALACTGVRVTSGMTGPYGRLNHFGHPDAEVRDYYVTWFKIFADIIADLGGKSIGTQFAILTYKDFDNKAAREQAIETALECWGRWLNMPPMPGCLSCSGSRCRSVGSLAKRLTRLCYYRIGSRKWTLRYR